MTSIKRLTIFAVLSIVCSLTQTALAATPNMFQCSSNNGEVEVSYTTTSFTGKPALNLMIKGHDAISVLGNTAEYNGTRAVVEQSISQFGTMTSVSLTDLSNTDAPIKLYGFILPTVHLASTSPLGEKVFFRSVLLLGEMLPQGDESTNMAYQNYLSSIELHCSAQRVLF